MDSSTTLSAGGFFMGKTTAPINFSGTYSVEAIAGQSTHAGSEIRGGQVIVLNCSENNIVKCVESSRLQNDIDQRQDANVQPMQIPRVGCTVIVEPRNDSNVNRGVHYTNQGSVTTCNNVRGKIVQNIFYRGGAPDPVPTANLPSNWEIHTNVGSVVRAGEVEQLVHFNADVPPSGLILNGAKIGTANIDGTSLTLVRGSVHDTHAGAKVVGNSTINTLNYRERSLATNDSTFNVGLFMNHPPGQAQANEPDFQINGRVAIFNQGFNRAGSGVDVENLKQTFQKRGVEPTILHNSTYDEIVAEINKLSTDNLSAYKLFVCIVMAHGDTHGIFDAADRRFLVKPTIIDPIMGNSTLNNIPKIFIIVACRGSAEYLKCESVKCMEENDMEIDGLGFDGRFSGPAGKAPYLISYSTMKGLVSYRTEAGTFFINSFCKYINEAKMETDLNSIFTRVNDDLANTYKIQVPAFETTMGDIRFKDLL